MFSFYHALYFSKEKQRKNSLVKSEQIYWDTKQEGMFP